MRKCEDCTLCCKLPEVTSIPKPRNTTCKYLSWCGGCSIYDQRPNECVEFDCLWLRNPDLPEALRPDRCGVIFEAHLGDHFVIAHSNTEDAWKKGEPIKLINQMLKDGFTVWILDGDKRHILLPEGVKEEEAVQNLRDVWEGNAWQRQVTLQI